MAIDIWQKASVIQHSQRLCQSFQKWTGRSLLPPPLLAADASPAAIAQALFHAPFVVVSHGTQADPVLNYGNQTALDLWQMDWTEFTQTPSRYTAQPDEREQRAELLERAKTQGWIDDYTGIRIAKTGQRFWIREVVLWTVVDAAGDRQGQAATFSTWNYI
jgi:MEKHLA domain